MMNRTVGGSTFLFLSLVMLVSTPVCNGFNAINNPSVFKTRLAYNGKWCLRSTIDTEAVQPTMADLNDLKADLVKACGRSPKESVLEIQDLVQQLESTGEMVRVLCWAHRKLHVFVHTLISTSCHD